MGSFNTSCFVTQQIVQPGDPVILFPIVQQRGSTVEVFTDRTHSETTPLLSPTSSTCHQDSFWGYSGPTIEGVYDDYGKFLLVDTPQNKAHLLAFFELLYVQLCDVKAGDNEYHDHPFTFRDLFDPIQDYEFETLQSIWGTLSELAHEHRLFLRVLRRADDVRPLSFAVVHRCAFEETLRLMETHTDWNHTPSSLEDSVRAALSNDYAKHCELLATSPGRSLTHFFGGRLESADMLRLGGNFYLHHYYPLPEGMDLFASVYGTESFEHSVSVFLAHRRALCEHLYFCGGLELMGVRLSPQVYAGQDYDNESGARFATLVQQVHHTLRARLDARDN